MGQRFLTPVLGALLVAGTGACMPGPSATPIMLSCTGCAVTDEPIVAAICDAIATEIAARIPERPLRRSSPNEPRVPGTWHVLLEVARTESYVWEGRLIWEVVGQESKAGRTVGPVVQISSVDAPLGPGAYRHFARDIVKVSQPTF